jgi:4-amino-4-deoxy-L-arabinose transferase-like glycosyltransferase
MPMAAVDAWKKRTVVPFLFFMLLGALLIILAYSFSSTKLINYTSPAYPFVAILIGAYASTLRSEKAMRIQLIILAIITLLFPAGFVIWARSDKLPELIPQVWMVFLLPLAAVGAWYLYAKKSSERWWLWLASGSMLFNMLFFAWLFPLLDATGSVKKLGPVVKAAKHVVAYKRLNDAFVFYHEKPIPVLPSAAEVRTALQEHPDLLVLQLGKLADLTDSVPELKLAHDVKDLFSSQHSYIYLKK